MNFEVFKSEVIRDLEAKFPEYDFEYQVVQKTSGSYTGLIVKVPESPASPSIDIGKYYSEYADSSYSEVLDRIIEQIESAIANIPAFDIHDIVDYQKAKDRLTIQLIPVSGNESYLAELPHTKVAGDLAIIYRVIVFETEEGISSTVITKDLFENFGISLDQLHEDALISAERMCPAKLNNMSEVLSEMMGDAPPDIFYDESPLWVATTKSGMTGSCVIAYQGFLEKASEKIGGDLFVIPSSVHEVILLKDDGSMDVEDLVGMVMTVNATELAPEDRLADNVYHYSRATDTISQCI